MTTAAAPTRSSPAWALVANPTDRRARNVMWLISFSWGPKASENQAGRTEPTKQAKKRVAARPESPCWSQCPYGLIEHTGLQRWQSFDLGSDMSTATTVTLYTPDDLLQMPDGDQYELVNGILVERKMSTWSSY